MNNWIQKSNLKKGVLERYYESRLGVPIKKRIPLRLLEPIKRAKIGDSITIKHGNRKITIKVTRKLKKRVVLAVTLQRLRQTKVTRRVRKTTQKPLLKQKLNLHKLRVKR